MLASKLRTIFQIVFLALFAFLVARGNVQVWIILLGLGWLVSLLIGRKYCGWVCPIGSIMRVQTWIYKLLKLPRFKIPNLNSYPRGRTLILILKLIMVAAFFMGMIAVRVLGIHINVILYLLILGVGISFFFAEDFWHRICPHGAILNLTSRPSPFGMKVNHNNCTGCGLCEKVCPNQAISKYADTKLRTINNKECLVCYECKNVCPAEAINYGKLSNIAGSEGVNLNNQ